MPSQGKWAQPSAKHKLLAPPKALKIPGLGPRRAQMYEAIRVLGRGAFGTAYLVRCRAGSTAAPGAQLVIKRVELGHMNEAQRKAAHAECAVMSQLREGPYIVRLHEHFEENLRLFMLMDFAGGGDLGHALARQREAEARFDEEQLLKWLVQLLLALRFAHSRKILHRDLKPQNVFLSASGDAVLGDFGISRVLNSSASLASTCIGTPLYLAPELVSGKSYDGACDIWSLGVLLYELCLLRPPFTAAVMPALVLRIMNEEPPPIPDEYSEGLRRLAPTLLSKAQGERPTAAALLADPLLSARAEAAEAAGATSRERLATDADDAAKAGRVVGRLFGRGTRSNRTADLRSELHSSSGRLDGAEAEQRRAEAGAKRAAAEARRVAQREQMKRDRAAASAAAVGDAAGAAGGGPPSEQPSRSHLSQSSLFELVMPAAPEEYAATQPATGAPPGSAAAVRPVPPARQLGDRTSKVDSSSADDLCRQAIGATIEGARLLSEAQREAAHASLEARSAEIMASIASAGALEGEEGRTLLNDAQRELVRISRLLNAVTKRYLVVLPPGGGGVARPEEALEALHPTLRELPLRATPNKARAGFEDNPTVFGQILRGELPADILYEDDECLVFRDIAPAAAHHALTIPKRRINDFNHLTSADVPLLRHMLGVAQRVVCGDTGLPMSDIEAARSSGALSFGYHCWPLISVYHLHLHSIYPLPATSWLQRVKFPERYGWFYVSPEHVEAQASRTRAPVLSGVG